MRNKPLSTNNSFIQDAQTGNLTTKQLAEKYKYAYSSVGNWCRRNKIVVRRDRQPNFDIDFFVSNIWTKEKAYVIGWICADGCIHNNTVSIYVKKDDFRIIKKIAQLTSFKNKIYEVSQYDKRTDKTYNRVGIHFNSKDLVYYLCNLGITEKKSLTLQMPKVPDEFMSHFVRGYFDGDGHISKILDRSGAAVGFSSSRDFLESLKAHLYKVIGENRGCIYQNGKISKLEYRGKASTKLILKWMYNDSTDNIRLQRKYDRYKQWY